MSEPLYAEAVFIQYGIIKSIGSNEDILKLKTDTTEIIDLNGRTMMPAFIDSHSHISMYATTLGLVSLSSATSYEDIIDKLNKYKEIHNIKKDEWIIGFGYGNNSFKDNQNPDKSVLDKVSKENPIIISHTSGHMGVVNSKALELLEITDKSKDPEGGHIGRVTNGLEPNGYLEENAFFDFSAKIPQPTMQQVLENFRKAQDIYLSYGITTAQEGMMKQTEFNLLKYLSDNRKLKLDVIGYVDIKNSENIYYKNKQYVNNYIGSFKIGGFKMFLDGSPQGKTAYLSRAYENSEDGYRGYPAFTDEEVKKFINTALNSNTQLLTHCNGDAAADQLISCFNDVVKENGYTDTHRPVMIHAQTVRYDQIDEMKKLNMIPSYFIAHTYYWGDIHLKNLGSERASRISPAKTTIAKGVTYTFHQDTPVIEPDMLETVWCAVNRITKSGSVLGDFERITPLEAFKGITINAAYQYFEEDKKGSIENGKLADFVILDKDPLKTDPLKIKDIRILETIKEGETLYKA